MNSFANLQIGLDDDRDKAVALRAMYSNGSETDRALFIDPSSQ